MRCMIAPSPDDPAAVRQTCATSARSAGAAHCRTAGGTIPRRWWVVTGRTRQAAQRNGVAAPRSGSVSRARSGRARLRPLFQRLERLAQLLRIAGERRKDLGRALEAPLATHRLQAQRVRNDALGGEVGGARLSANARRARSRACRPRRSPTRSPRVAAKGLPERRAPSRAGTRCRRRSARGWRPDRTRKACRRRHPPAARPDRRLRGRRRRARRAVHDRDGRSRLARIDRARMGVEQFV